MKTKTKLGITAKPLPKPLERLLMKRIRDDRDITLSPGQLRGILGALEHERQQTGEARRAALESSRIAIERMAPGGPAKEKLRHMLLERLPPPLPDPERLGLAVGKAVAKVLASKMGGRRG